MNDEIRTIIQRVHESSFIAAFCVTGAGSEALAMLLGVPGASGTVLEAVVPYSRRAMITYLGWQPVQFVDVRTAESLAAAACVRARGYCEDDVPVFGVSCTAAIVTDRPRKGEHRCHVALWDGDSVTTYSLMMEKGRRRRSAEEMLVSRLILRAIVAACGLDDTITLDLSQEETVKMRRLKVDRSLERLFGREVDSLTVYGPETMVGDEPLRAAILPGSFNPLHHGHLKLARVAEQQTGLPVVFEIATHNVDKPPLTVSEIHVRLRQFEDKKWRVVLTREPLYAGKAQVLPGCTFVIGYDTAVRLLDPAYYGGSTQEMYAALETIRDQGCRFLVAGREVDGEFKTLDAIDLPQEFKDLFEAIPEEKFRVDISSTELRRLKHEAHN